jgi:hypothetical protein
MEAHFGCANFNPNDCIYRVARTVTPIRPPPALPPSNVDRLARFARESVLPQAAMARRSTFVMAHKEYVMCGLLLHIMFKKEPPILIRCFSNYKFALLSSRVYSKVIVLDVTGRVIL